MSGQNSGSRRSPQQEKAREDFWVAVIVILMMLGMVCLFSGAPIIIF